MDIGHKRTEAELRKLEREIELIYKRSSKEIQKKLREKYKQLKDADTKEIREQIRYLEDTLKRVTIEQENANKIAMDMLQGELERITDINNAFTYNYILDRLKDEGLKNSFNVTNPDALKEILKGDIYKELAIANITDKNRIYKEFKRAMAQSYILGEGEVKRAKRIQKLLDNERYEAIRIARTENTKAECLARDASIRDAINLGIRVKKEWASVGDKRVRHTHQAIDKEVVEYDKKFSNGCDFPGIGGPASEVIMCRCTFLPVMEDY